MSDPQQERNTRRRAASAVGGAEGIIDAVAPQAAGLAAVAGGMVSSALNPAGGPPSSDPERAERRSGRLDRKERRERRRGNAG